MKKFADQTKQLFRHAFVATGRARITRTRERTVIHVPRLPLGKGSFWYKQTGSTGQTITVATGYFTIHGKIDYAVPETAITLSGATECVYVEWELDAATATIQHAATCPGIQANYIREKLYTFALSAETGRYALSQIHHYGDVTFAAVPR